MLSPTDLAAYFERIGYAGAREPTLAALSGIVFAHATRIPFENFDVLLGRGVRLDTGALVEKLVHGGRGGYCFEHNSLLRQALDAIGCDAEGLAARVVWGQREDGALPRTHMLLRVRLPEGDFLADVGFGGVTLTAPLRLEADLEQTTPHEPHRLVEAAGEVELQASLDGEWTRLYRFGPTPQLPVDYQMANWFTSTYPGGLFTENLLMARPEPDRRYALFNRDFTIRHRDGRVERRVLDGAAELADVLARNFHLELPAADMAAAWQRIGSK